MAIFKKRFATADEYEDWLQQANGRVNVLSINKAPTIYGSSIQQPTGPVILKYQTTDKSFAAPRIVAGRAVEYAIVGAAFFVLVAYVISEL